MKSVQSISRVLIVGGTHGNELIGVYLIQKLERHPQSIQRSSFETMTLWANPQAFAANCRYVDLDLNRCFRRSDLQNLSRLGYEDLRAREIDRRFGLGGETPVDVIVDLHSTTANMGLTIITDEHPFNLRLAAYINLMQPSVRIYVSTLPQSERSSLRSICALGCTIEVGPVAQGTLQADLFQKTEGLIQVILDYLELYNCQTVPGFEEPLTVYQHIDTIDYPRGDRNNLQAMIHPQLQFRDYEPLQPGELMFLTFEGEAIAYEGPSTVYPVFINEAAYYEKGIAFAITARHQVNILG